METPPPLRYRVAAELRAEMGYQGRKIAELATALGLGYAPAKRRYDGDLELTLDEIELLSAWLEVDKTQLLTGRRERASA